MGRKDWKGGKLKLCDFRLPLRSTWELHSSQSKTALTKAEGTGAVSQSATHQATFPVHFAWMEIELSNLLGCVVHVSWICCKHTGMLDVDPMSHVDAMHSYFSGCPKADSHTACCAHAVPLPCRAAKGLECVFPISFTQCGHVWFTLAMPCSEHDVLLKATAQHGHQEMVCGLPAPVRLLLAITRRSTKIVIRSIPILLTTIHNYDCKEW